LPKFIVTLFVEKSPLPVLAANVIVLAELEISVRLPPPYIEPPMPAPPATCKAPVVVLTEFVVDWMVAVVATVRPFLTLKSCEVAI
jgi:hypothetical protein